MRNSWAPSLVPNAEGHTFYIVIEQFGSGGLIPETKLERTSLEDVVSDLAAGQYDRPLEIVAFNPTEVGRKTLPSILPPNFSIAPTSRTKMSRILLSNL